MERATIEKIYERLRTFSLDLPRDPTSLGVEFLREQISLCRNYLNEASHYYQDILIEESFLATQLDAEESAYQIRANEMLASDPRVATRPNIVDRQAMIDTLLIDEKRSIIRLQSQLRSLGHVKTVVAYRKKELDNTMSALRLQRSLLSDQMRTGAFYGDESERSRGRAGDPADGMDGTDLEALVAASAAEIHAEAEAAPTGAVQLLQSEDPADALEGAEFEALVQEAVAAPDAPPVLAREVDVGVRSTAPLAVVTGDTGGDDEDQLHAAISRFLLEPSDDVESILAGV